MSKKLWLFLNLWLVFTVSISSFVYGTVRIDISKLPGNWVLEKQFTGTESDLKKYSQKLNGKLIELNNYFFNVSGEKIQINIVKAEDEFEAYKIYDTLINMKGFQYCYRTENIVIEYITSNLKNIHQANQYLGLHLISIPENIYSPVTASNLPQGVYAEILPEMELLAGVLSQTSWMNIRGPRGTGNQYFQELQQFFEPFKNHPAVMIGERLTKSGFTYDAPPSFITFLGPLPELKQETYYSDYLIQRAHGQKNLDEFRKALIDLNHESNFSQFFQDHRDILEVYLNGTLGNFNSAKIINWLRNFYGWSGDQFHMVFSPAMFPGGGYGSMLQKNNQTIIYQIIRNSGRSGVPDFPTGTDLEQLTLHEWGHSFVNPSLEKYPTQLRKLNPLYLKVSKIMEKQAYGTPETFFNEQVLRAVTAIAAKELYGNETFEWAVSSEKKNGFYLTEFIIKQLDVYQKNRTIYPRFDEFVPYLLDQLYTHRDELLK